MNKFFLMGNLTADPDCAATGSGSRIARFRIAVDRRIKGKTETSFFPITTFGASAEFVEKYLKKGTGVVIEGRLQSNSVEDKQNPGKHRTFYDFIAENIEFAGRRAASSEPAVPKSPAPVTSDDPAAPAASNPQPDASGPDGFVDVPDDMQEELPFV